MQRAMTRGVCPRSGEEAESALPGPQHPAQDLGAALDGAVPRRAAAGGGRGLHRGEHGHLPPADRAAVRGLHRKPPGRQNF